ncbi:hypothetical protein EL22_28635 [Halostagnicola sp. A56]|nr:hypothetical protein EL22_28635 [Halostagnicola sp. A56]
MVHKKEEHKKDCYGDEVREHILEFADEGFESIPEDERDKWFTRFKSNRISVTELSPSSVPISKEISSSSSGSITT